MFYKILTEMFLELNIPLLIFSYIHFFFYMLVCFSPIIFPYYCDFYIYLFMNGVILQWILMDGCILTNKDVFKSDFVRVLYFSGLFNDLNYIDTIDYISNLVIIPAYFYYTMKLGYLVIFTLLFLCLVFDIKIK